MHLCFCGYKHIVLKELMSEIMYASNTTDVWTDLKEQFDKVDGVGKIFYNIYMKLELK